MEFLICFIFIFPNLKAYYLVLIIWFLLLVSWCFYYQFTSFPC